LVQLRENRVKRKLLRGETVNVLSGHHTADSVDFLGPLGFDGIWIEAEHGPNDYREVPDLTRACDLWGMTSIVRVNLNLPGVIYRTLDVGAQGIVVPHVNTADEARAVVDAAKFHPLGSRGCFPSRQGYGVDDYLNKANDETLIVVLIEDIVAIENLSEIVTVDQIDVFFVAPGDLAQTMGLLGQPFHPEVQAVVDSAFEKIIAAGRVAGALTPDNMVEHYVERGVLFLHPGWQGWMMAGARSYQARLAAALGQA
jgi:4-hydroxy-2-oxoheptanedioate aldolase